MMQMSCSAEGPHRQRSQDVRLLEIIDILPVLSQHAYLGGDLLNHLQRLPAKQLHDIKQIEDRIHERPRAAAISSTFWK
jgi:hypothetical protein